VRVFFADPRSPWQRGTNENTNGLLRQYFPKGTDLSRWSEQEIQAVARTLNNRPRKTLGWKTPAETLNQYVGADPNLSHRADRILSQGWGPAFRGPAVDKCRSVLAL
jgi:transposase InsO family protein